jgi:CRISPR/Cas system-associated exonuclease Cas4 (RecB family)
VDKHITETEGKPSASRFDAIFRCLGRWALERQLPPEPDNKATKRGTTIHEALEKSDLSQLNKSDEITASRCMYAEAELIHKHGFEGAEVHWEERIWDIDDNFQPAWSAKMDAIHLLGDRALVGDYKTGFGMTQPIERNWQIAAQAAIVRATYGVKEVIGALIHPHHPDSLYEDIQFTEKKLDANLLTIRGKVAEIEIPDQPRTPNAISCQYCRAKNICPEYKARMEKLAKDVIDESKDAGFTRIIARTPDERGRHIKSLKMLEKGIDDLLAQYGKLLASGDKATGWHLVKAWMRDVTNDGLAITMTRNAWGDQAVTAALQFNLVALQEFLAKGRTKAEAKEQVETVLKDILKFTPKKAALKETVV